MERKRDYEESTERKDLPDVLGEDFDVKYAVDYLTKALIKDYPEGLGITDKSIDKLKEAELCASFERNIYLNRQGRFLIDKGGNLCIFDGKGYRQAYDENFLYHVIKESMRNAGIGKLYLYNSPAKIAKECLLSMSADRRYLFSPNRRYIIFNNCVLHLSMDKNKPDEILEHSPKYRTDLVLDFDYDPNTRSALWDKFFMETIPNKDDRVAFQMFCGAILSDREIFKMEYILFILGPGGNGKSVLTKAIRNVFGKGLISRFSPHQLFTSSQAMYNIAAVDGKLANICDDVTNAAFSNGDFKSFVSGEPMMGRHPYGRRTIEVKAPLMMCNANNMPSSPDDSEGYHRRILPIGSNPHVFTEDEKDTTLANQLSTIECQQAIFNWLYEGFMMYRENNGKIIIGEGVKMRQQELKDDNSSIRRWLRERMYDKPMNDNPEKTLEDGNWRPFNDLYADYVDYCNKNNEGDAQKPRQLGRLFKGAGYPDWRIKNKVHYYVVQKNDEGEEVTPHVIDDSSLPF